MKWEQDYDVQNFACACYGEKKCDVQNFACA